MFLGSRFMGTALPGVDRRRDHLERSNAERRSGGERPSRFEPASWGKGACHVRLERDAFERLTRPELIGSASKLRRPTPTSRTSSEPHSTDRKARPPDSGISRRSAADALRRVPDPAGSWRDGTGFGRKRRGTPDGIV